MGPWWLVCVVTGTGGKWALWEKEDVGVGGTMSWDEVPSSLLAATGLVVEVLSPARSLGGTYFLRFFGGPVGEGTAKEGTPLHIPVGGSISFCTEWAYRW